MKETKNRTNIPWPIQLTTYACRTQMVCYQDPGLHLQHHVHPQNKQKQTLKAKQLV